MRISSSVLPEFWFSSWLKSTQYDWWRRLVSSDDASTLQGSVNIRLDFVCCVQHRDAGRGPGPEYCSGNPWLPAGVTLELRFWSGKHPFFFSINLTAGGNERSSVTQMSRTSGPDWTEPPAWVIRSQSRTRSCDSQGASHQQTSNQSGPTASGVGLHRWGWWWWTRPVMKQHIKAQTWADIFPGGFSSVLISMSQRESSASDARFDRWSYVTTRRDGRTSEPVQLRRLRLSYQSVNRAIYCWIITVTTTAAARARLKHFYKLFSTKTFRNVSNL